jgi:hypothetical protein
MRMSEQQYQGLIRNRQAVQYQAVKQFSRPVSYGRNSQITLSNGMNKLENRYASEILSPSILSEEITSWKFQSLKLKLAHRTFYTPDFILTLPDGHIEIHEVKGHWEDDARVKIKVAAQMFPEFVFTAVRWDKSDGWRQEKISRG